MSKKLSSIRVYGTDAPAVPLPPGGLIEIVFSFDTTGSMVECLNEVRGRIGDMIQRLQADIPAFGSRSWLTATTIRHSRDATPHPASFYARRDEKLDWKEEAKKLAAMAYEEEVRGREGAHGLHKDLEGVFGALKAGKRASVKTLPKLSAGKAKKTAAPTKRAAKGKAAATAKAKKTTAAASKGKGKATAGKAKGKGKATAGKAKGKAVAPKAKAAAKGKGATGKGAAAKGTVKAKAAKGKAKELKPKRAKAAAKAARGKGVKSVKWRKTTKTQKKKPTKGKTNIQKTKPKSGFRNMVLLQDDKKCPALYELMAEITPAPPSLQFGSEVIWEAALINKASLKPRWTALLEDGRGRLYIRRGDAKDSKFCVRRSATSKTTTTTRGRRAHLPRLVVKAGNNGIPIAA
nr:hypothetical protein BaRGS_017302 [Batillaria attramentaria]